MSELRGIKFELKIEEVILNHAMELCLHLYHNLKNMHKYIFHKWPLFSLLLNCVCTCVHNNVLFFVVLTGLGLFHHIHKHTVPEN